MYFRTRENHAAPKKNVAQSQVKMAYAHSSQGLHQAATKTSGQSTEEATSKALGGWGWGGGWQKHKDWLGESKLRGSNNQQQAEACFPIFSPGIEEAHSGSMARNMNRKKRRETLSFRQKTDERVPWS